MRSLAQESSLLEEDLGVDLSVDRLVDRGQDLELDDGLCVCVIVSTSGKIQKWMSEIDIPSQRGRRRGQR